MTLIIPMAGNGQRFRDAGYSFPKPLIPVPPYETMIEMVIHNLDYDGQHIFLVQQAHIDEFHIDKTLKLLEPGCIVVPVDGITEGAACTILLAEKYLNAEEELIIANSDQYVPNFHMKNFLAVTFSPGDGGIVTFNATHPKWSFVRLGRLPNPEPYENVQVVVEVAEKNPISNIATAGIYAFKRSKDFVWAAKQMIEKNIRTNGEFYLCPVYNELIAAGQIIFDYRVKTIYGTGTPEDLQTFLNREQ